MATEVTIPKAQRIIKITAIVSNMVLLQMNLARERLRVETRISGIAERVRTATHRKDPKKHTALLSDYNEVRKKIN
jgi:hypothetical protein